MKKLTILLLPSLLFLNCISQQTDPSFSLPKPDYLRKSKQMNVAAFSLLGGGVVMATVGTINAAEEVATFIENPFSPPADEKRLDRGAGLILVGSIAVLAQYPFLNSSSKNKKNALKLSFSPQKIQQLLLYGSFAHRSVPSLNLKVDL